MADYIEREKVKLCIFEYGVRNRYNSSISSACENLERRMNYIPAADVRPVVRGKWTRRKSKLYTMCSACGYGYSNSHYHEVEEFKFCPNCGAMMEASDGED